jgi:alpha-amylase
MMTFYADMGILKFRLDAAKHFFDDPGVTGFDLKAGLFILELNAFLKRTYGSESFILSEVFDYYPFVYNNYYIGSDSLFNFYGRSQILEKVGNQTSRGTFVSLMSRFYEDIAFIRPDFVDAIFISNHDLDRLKSTNNNVLSRQQMVHVLLTLPGSPFVYYGEELDMEGRRQEGVDVIGYGTAYDEFRRTAFLWEDAQKTSWFPDIYNDNTPSLDEQIEDPASMYHVYQRLMQLRLNYPALRYGDFEIFSGNDYNIQGYSRTITQGNLTQQVIVIHNIDSKPATIEAIPGASFIYGNQYEIEAYGTIMLLIETIEGDS